MRNLRTIAVDMVPMLPGGDNGGAKIFVLELLRTLPKIAPQAKFVLLTRRSSHHELDSFVGQNVTRQMVWDDRGEPTGLKYWIRRIGAAIARRSPALLQCFMPAQLRLVWQRFSGRTNTASIITQIGADLLYCPFGGTVFGDTSVPMAVTVYDLQYLSYPQFFAPEDVAGRADNFRRACAMSAMAVISDYVRDSVIAQGLVDPSRVFTIYIQLPKRLHSVDEDRQHHVLNKFALRAKGYFIYPANFWLHKNHKNLIAAFAIALRTGLPTDTKLVLTGAPSPRTQEVVNEAKAKGVEHLIVSPGFIEENELAALMMSALAMINPSLYEGFGMPVLEAMALDLPVACSNVTSLPEVAGDAAILFGPHNPSDIANSMIRLATDEKLRKELVARGRERANHFADTLDMARQYWKLFEMASDGSVYIPSTNGIHVDHWAGPQIVLRYPAGHPERTARMEIELPQWAPHSAVVLDACGHDGRKLTSHTAQRGIKQTVDIAIGPAPGSTIISIGPHFRPSDITATSDSRDLSIIVHKLEFCAPDNTIVIFPSSA